MKKRLIAALIFVNILSYTSIAFAEDITNLIQQQNDLQNQKSEADNKLEIVQDELSENMQQVEKLSQAMSEYQTQIDE